LLLGDPVPTLVREKNEIFLVRMWKPLPSICFLNFEEKPKRTISVSGSFGELGLLQMLSNLGYE